MPRPFGVWAPATSIAELKARVPRPFDFTYKIHMFVKTYEYFYQPDLMAWFKDPQHFKDTTDTLRSMRTAEKFFGDGCKWPAHAIIKMTVMVAIEVAIAWLFVVWFYTKYVPANNPTWRKTVNKEWDEAINNSPWDHMSHVWAYTDISGVTLGTASIRGKKKFIIPA